jgi:hypothetical protein
MNSLTEAEGKEQYHVEVSYSFVAFEDLDAEVRRDSRLFDEGLVMLGR